jgi:hypothetical protein
MQYDMGSGLLQHTYTGLNTWGVSCMLSLGPSGPLFVGGTGGRLVRVELHGPEADAAPPRGVQLLEEGDALLALGLRGATDSGELVVASASGCLMCVSPLLPETARAAPNRALLSPPPPAWSAALACPQGWPRAIFGGADGALACYDLEFAAPVWRLQSCQHPPAPALPVESLALSPATSSAPRCLFAASEDCLRVYANP